VSNASIGDPDRISHANNREGTGSALRSRPSGAFDININDQYFNIDDDGLFGCEFNQIEAGQDEKHK